MLLIVLKTGKNIAQSQKYAFLCRRKIEKGRTITLKRKRLSKHSYAKQNRSKQ
jgi:hypothetical protein